MSGIAGIIRFDGAPVDTDLIEGMTAAMARRGPDGIRHHVAGGIALGHCMLRTTPESLEEEQPLSSGDGALVLVMDGRVDNWEELRERLACKGARLRTRADAELVICAYERWGRDCLDHIDGDFAFVIWDARRREAFCARDRMGVRPFHYHWDGRRLSFASDLNAILALPWVPEEFNDGMAAEFLACDWQSRDETFWRGIRRLPPAHRMLATADRARAEQYWMPDPDRRVRYGRDAEYIEHYRDLLCDTVRRLSRSHRPLACEVSGGLDSSAVFAIAEHLRREGRLLAPSVDGYTLAFGDASKADETSYARAVGQHLGREIHEVAPSRLPLRWFEERAAFHRDFPGVPNGVMGLGIRAAARDRGSRAILTGLGGDQWIGGSRKYYAEAIAAADLRMLVRHLGEDGRAHGVRRTLWWVLRFGLAPLLPARARRLVQPLPGEGGSTDRSDWLSQRLAADLESRRERWDRAGPVARYPASKRDRATFLLDAYLGQAFGFEDRLASGCAVEMRHPLYSKPIVELSFAFPEHIFLRGSKDRFVHSAALSGMLPDSVAFRKSKAEFSSTYRWYLDAVRSSIAEPRDFSGWVRKNELEALLALPPEAALVGIARRKLWNLWACKAVDGRVKNLL